MNKKDRNTLSFDLRTKKTPNDNESESINVRFESPENVPRIENYESSVIELVEGFLQNDETNKSIKEESESENVSKSKIEREEVAKRPDITSQPPKQKPPTSKKHNDGDVKRREPSYRKLYITISIIATVAALSGSAIGYIALNGVPNGNVEQIIHEQKALTEEMLGVFKNEIVEMKLNQSEINEDFKFRINAAETDISNVSADADNINTKSQMAINSLTPMINSNKEQINSIKQREMDIIQQMIEGDEKIEVVTKEVIKLGEKIRSVESDNAEHNQFMPEIEKLKEQLSKVSYSSTKISSIEEKIDSIKSDFEKIAQTNKRMVKEESRVKESAKNKDSYEKTLGNIVYRIIFASDNKALIRVKTPSSEFNKAYYVGDSFEGKGVIKGFEDKKILIN